MLYVLINVEIMLIIIHGNYADSFYDTEVKTALNVCNGYARFYNESQHVKIYTSPSLSIKCI